ncbi:MAG: cell division protein FtsA [Candidatus Saccharibacteria bacterium]
MAAQKHEATFVGLDIGSSKVVCIVGLHQQDLATPSIIGVGTAPVSGLKRGVVTDVEETVSAITAALEEAERMSGIAIDGATINVDGSHLQGINKSGVVAVSRADREIVADDLSRAELVASNINLEANRQIINVIPKAYHVDDQKNVSDPVGMHGIKLEIDAFILTGSTPAMKNLQNAVFRSGIAINQQTATAVAAAKALLTKQQRELGVAVINFGSESTSLAVFEQGSLNYLSVLPLGSSSITKDLVYGLRITPEVAENLKIQHAIAAKPRGKTNKHINLEEFGAAGNVYQHDIDTIVSSRLEEIFQLTEKELKKAISTSGGLGAGIILTGGGANMPEITNFAKHIIGAPVHLGRVTGYTGISDKISDPTYSVAVGLMLEDMEVPAQKRHNQLTDILKSTLQRLKSIVKGLMP